MPSERSPCSQWSRWLTYQLLRRAARGGGRRDRLLPRGVEKIRRRPVEHLCLLEETAADVSERHARPVTMKQLDAQLVLELVNVPAEGRLRDVQALSGFRDAR